MSFKYQSPANYQGKCLVVSGQRFEVKNGVIESDQDIYHIIKPLGFERVLNEPVAKKEVAAKT